MRKYLNHLTGYFGAELIAKLSPFLLIPFLTRYMTQEEFGKYSADQALINLGVILFLFSFDAGIIRFQYSSGNAVSLLLLQIYRIILIIASFIFLILSIVVELNLYIIFGIISIAWLKIELSYLQSKQNSKLYFIISALVSLFTLIFVIGSFQMFDFQATSQNRINSGTMAIIISCCLYYILTLKIYYININKKIGIKRLKYLISRVLPFTIPLVFTALASFFKNQYDKIYLSEVFDYESIAIYSLGFQLSSMILLIYIALSKTLESILYPILKKDNENAICILNRSTIYSTVSFIPYLISVLLPESLFIWLFGVQYGGVNYYFSFFLLGFAFQFTTIGSSLMLTYIGNTKLLFILNVITVLFYLVLLICFSELGIRYVPTAFVLSNFTYSIMIYIFARRKFAISI